jgi:hypothetical protein
VCPRPRHLVVTAAPAKGHAGIPDRHQTDHEIVSAAATSSDRSTAQRSRSIDADKPDATLCVDLLSWHQSEVVGVYLLAARSLAF